MGAPATRIYTHRLRVPVVNAVIPETAATAPHPATNERRLAACGRLRARGRVGDACLESANVQKDMNRLLYSIRTVESVRRMIDNAAMGYYVCNWTTMLSS